MKKQMDKSLRILWIIIGLFLIVLAGKIIVTPFELNFSVLITFLLALFTIGISLFFYLKVNTLLEEVKKQFQSYPFVINRDDPDRFKVLEQEIDIDVKEDEIDDGLDPKLQLEFEERTLKLKEEERQQLLERLIDRAGLDESEKTVYMTQLEKVDNDLFNIRSNLNQLRKKINQSFSEMFILEKTKLIRDIIDKLGIDFVIERSFVEINERFKALQNQIPQASLDYLEENAYIDSEGNLTRKGYREFIRVAKKM